MKVKTQYKKNDNNSIVLNMNDWDKLNTEIISLSSHKHHRENFKVLSLFREADETKSQQN